MSSALQSLRPQLDRVRRAWRASPLPRFFAWWGGELRALLPLRWRSLFSSGACWYLLEREGVTWSVRRAGQNVALAHWDDDIDARLQQVALQGALQGADPEDVRLALCLPAGEALRRNLQLPLAARDNLRQVASYEMDRQTPFRAAQVHYAVRELAQAASADRFWAELVVVPRARLDMLLARLAELGISIDAVDLDQDGDRLGVNLLPPEALPKRVSPRRRLNLALAAGSVVLLLLVLAQYVSNRQAALAAMQTQVEAMRGEAQQVVGLRQRLQDHAGAAGFLTQRKHDTVAVLDVIQDLTRRLPLTASLERLSIDNSGQLGFQGQSPQAASLIDALKGSTLFSGLNFQGTIQRDPVTTKERFYMIAQLRKPATAAKPAVASSSPSPVGGGAR